MIAADSSPAPIAALASVLPISIAACSIACAGRSDDEKRVTNSAKSRATVIFSLLTRNNAVRDGATTLTASPAKAGVHLSAAGAADRWVPAFAGKAVRAWFHPGWVGRAGRWQLVMTAVGGVNATAAKPNLGGAR